jgi:dihydrofolate reductase
VSIPAMTDRMEGMGKLTVITNLTLDGVMQAPARPDEDTRDGFRHGGWAVPYSHDAMGRLLADGPGTGAMLFGRRTYDDFAEVWPKQPPNPYTDVLNRNHKYVVTSKDNLTWQNSTAVTITDIAEIKKDHDLVVLGSGAVIRGILSAVDEFKLLIHPLVLGEGRRLFGPDPVDLRLTDSVTTTTGVLIATYTPAGKPGDQD